MQGTTRGVCSEPLGSPSRQLALILLGEQFAYFICGQPAQPDAGGKVLAVVQQPGRQVVHVPGPHGQHDQHPSDLQPAERKSQCPQGLWIGPWCIIEDDRNWRELFEVTQ